MSKDKNIPIKDKMLKSKLIKIVPFDNNKSNTVAHKHNGYLELVFLMSTKGSHEIDGISYKIKNPCLLVIRKNAVHHWNLQTPVDGYVILLKNEYISTSLDLEIGRLIEKITKVDYLKLQETTALKAILNLLVMEENSLVIEGLFKSLLAKTVEYQSTSKAISAGKSSLYNDMLALLHNGNKIINSVAYYADILNTTPQNLNSSCKKYANLSASEVIAAQLIKEAKRLIYYTPKSMSEIAHEIGFSDKSNFSKYFKKHTGLTPKQYKHSIA